MNEMARDIVVTFLASFLIYLLYLGLLILWVIDGRIKKEQVLHALYSTFLAFLTTQIIKILFPTLRPYVLNGMDTYVFLDPIDGAFPSSHTATAFALSVTVFLHDRKVGAAFLILALIIGTARVLANVHYPADILGGALIGTLIAILVDKTHLLRFVDLFSLSKKANKKRK